MIKSFTESVSQYWASAEFGNLPSGVIAKAKESLLDNVAAACIGSGSEEWRAMRRGLGDSTGSCEQWATIWGTGDLAPAPLAALLNGTAAHARELDDIGGGHTGAVVIPASVAVGERLHVNGRQLILAVAAGYDIGRRVLEALGGYDSITDNGWHATGISGSFAAAACSARLMNLDVATFANALGIAGTYCGGTWAFLEDGSMTKRMHPGLAAKNGVTAAFLARNGFTGPTRIIEASWGGIAYVTGAGTAHLEVGLGGLGRDFRIMRTARKQHACCGASHAAMDQIIEVMAQYQLQPNDIREIRVNIGFRNMRLASRRIRNTLEAQMSYPYALAVAASGMSTGVESFTEPCVSDRTVLSMMDRVVVTEDPTIGKADNPEVGIGDAPRLQIALKDGRLLKPPARRSAIGYPDDPLPASVLERKVLGALTSCVGADAAHEFLSRVNCIEDSDNIAEVVDLLGNRATMLN